MSTVFHIPRYVAPRDALADLQRTELSALRVYYGACRTNVLNALDAHDDAAAAFARAELARTIRLIERIGANYLDSCTEVAS